MLVRWRLLYFLKTSSTVIVRLSYPVFRSQNQTPFRPVTTTMRIATTMRIGRKRVTNLTYTVIDSFSLYYLLE